MKKPKLKPKSKRGRKLRASAYLLPKKKRNKKRKNTSYKRYGNVVPIFPSFDGVVENFLMGGLLTVLRDITEPYMGYYPKSSSPPPEPQPVVREDRLLNDAKTIDLAKSEYSKIENVDKSK